MNLLGQAWRRRPWWGESKRGALALALATLTLAGCSGGLRSNAPPDQTYVLHPAAGPASQENAPAHLRASLQVSRPLPQPGLESDRIMVVRGDRQLDRYAASRWAGPLPEVLAAFTAQALRASGRFDTVVDDRSPFLADYLLRITVRHFEAQYAGTADLPQVHVALDCIVGRRSDREVLASFTAESTAAVATNRLADVVEAFERATRATLASIIDDTAAAIAAEANRPLRTSTAPSAP